MLDDLNMELRNNYSGTNCIICQADGDEGDSLQRTATYYTLMKYLNESTDYKGLTLEEGLSSSLYYFRPIEGSWYPYSRSPDKSKWYGNYRYTSRDQLSIAMVACASIGLKDELLAMFKGLLKDVGFHTNIFRNGIEPDKQAPKCPDVISPEELASVIRGLNLWWLLPALCVLDLSLLAMSIFGRNFKPWDADNMLLSHHLLADSKLPTPISWLAKKIYATKQADILFKLYAYHSLPNNGIPPLAILQTIAAKKLFKSVN